MIDWSKLLLCKIYTHFRLVRLNIETRLGSPAYKARLEKLVGENIEN